MIVVFKHVLVWGYAWVAHEAELRGVQDKLGAQLHEAEFLDLS